MVNRFIVAHQPSTGTAYHLSPAKISMPLT